MTFIDAHRGKYGVEPMCAVLPIAPSTYQEAKARVADPSRRQRVRSGIACCARTSTTSGGRIAGSTPRGRSGDSSGARGSRRRARLADTDAYTHTCHHRPTPQVGVGNFKRSLGGEFHASNDTQCMRLAWCAEIGTEAATLKVSQRLGDVQRLAQRTTSVSRIAG